MPTNTFGLRISLNKTCKKVYHIVKYICNERMILMDIVYILIGLVIGVVLGFFLARFYMKKYLKKNPPINEQMIKAMMMQMGRTPSQKQVNQMMKSMNKYM